jgi:hypothetical protein
VGNEGAAHRFARARHDDAALHRRDTTDKEMSTAFSPVGKDVCSKQDIQKAATRYVS